MLQDSGTRKQFESGAVRDVCEGKGRMDLLPLDVIQDFMDCKKNGKRKLLPEVAAFQETGDPKHLIYAAVDFAESHFENRADAVIEYSKHMEDGCVKYGERNWQKGIPLDRYVDSGLRHYMKVLRGDDDERHDRAVLWNFLCGAWTATHMPDLNVYK